MASDISSGKWQNLSAVVLNNVWWIIVHHTGHFKFDIVNELEVWQMSQYLGLAIIIIFSVSCFFNTVYMTEKWRYIVVSVLCNNTTTYFRNWVTICVTNNVTHATSNIIYRSGDLTSDYTIGGSTPRSATLLHSLDKKPHFTMSLSTRVFK